MELTLNREYKDRVFRDIFGKEERKEYTLSLYNAVNGTHYTDPNLIQLNTLQNFIYMKMKNDVSFIIDAQLELYEHQSTFNPNMPYRCFQYLAALYDTYLEQREEKEWIYDSEIVLLPTPQCVVFYNGERKTEDVFELSLKDSFTVPEKSCLDLTVKVINCNYGRNEALMEHCQELRDYAQFVDRSRKYLRNRQETQLTKEEAVLKAIDEMIKQNGPLAPYFKAQRSEVCHLFILDYDEEKTLKSIGERHEQMGKDIRDQEKIQEMLAAGKTPEAIIEFCNYPASLVYDIANKLK